jgi:hypothetical protein
MHSTALYHMLVSFGLMPTYFFLYDAERPR